MSFTPQSNAFFSPGDPPPAFTPPPPDAALAQRISKLVEFAVRNGPSFVGLAREKQAGNAEYAFLKGGPGADFFSWLLFASVNRLPPDQPLPSRAAAPAGGTGPAVPGGVAGHAPSDPGHPPPLPSEVATGWAQVLAHLSGSRDSVRASQAWFMACRPHAVGMAAMLAQACLDAREAARQLHLLYLANDVLFKALAGRPPGSGPDGDDVTRAFEPRMGSLLRHTFVTGGQTEEARAPLLKMVNFWAEKGVFSQLAVERMTMELLGVSGLIPKLVEETLKTEVPYSPLSIRSIGEAGVPPPPEMDAYLAARLDKFYAQIADFRPGMSFVDLESELPRRRTFNDRGAEEASAARSTRSAGPLDDGSGPQGARGSAGAMGLGYSEGRPAAAGDKVDVFDKYRSALSGAYFEQIHRSLAKRGG